VTRGFTGALEAASPALPTGVNHALVRSLPVAPVTLFECRSVRRAASATKRLTTTVTPLLVSHPFPRAWAEADFESRQSLQPGGENDTDGPVLMAAAVSQAEGSREEPRLIVVGDAEFAANRAVSNPAGRAGLSFQLTGVDWLRGRAESMGDIPPRRHEARQLAADAVALRGLAWKSSLFLCAMIVTAGATVWTKRRNG